MGKYTETAKNVLTSLEGKPNSPQGHSPGDAEFGSPVYSGPNQDPAPQRNNLIRARAQAAQEFVARYVPGTAEYLAKQHPALLQEIWDVQRRMARLARSPMSGLGAEEELRTVVATWLRLWKEGLYFFKTSAAALPPD